jgi:hypothetical protein
MSLTEDRNCQLAYDILARKLNDESLINRIGAVAIHYNLDVARKYASPDDISELEERFGRKE